MITQHDLEKYDPSGMHKIYDRWPEIAKQAYDCNLESIDFPNIDNVIFAGMGGSGAIGDLFSSILSKSNIHVSLVKGYLLPKTVDKNTLVITTSISGNSAETLTVLESAKNLDCSLVAFSSGGKMEQFCTQEDINYRKIELIHSPRTSFINYTYSILKILDSVFPISKNEITESIHQLDILKDKISSQNLTDSNPAINFAYWIPEIPLVYYPHGLQSAAIRFKSSLQENAKSHVIIEDVIEACHNGIVSWEKPSNVKPVLIEGIDDYVKTKQRWKIIKDYLKQKNIDYREIHSIEGNILSKLVHLFYLFDYTSIYNAIIHKTDPTPVKSIEFVKNRLT